MKKFLSIFLSMIMILSCFSIGIIASASGEAKVSVSSVTGNAGETVKLVFALSDCDDAKALTLYDFVFDDSAIEIVEGKWLISNAAIQDFNAGEKIAVAAFSANTAINGNIFELTLKIKDTAQAGEYSFDYGIVVKKAVDGIEEGIMVAVENGKITVKKSEGSDTPETPDDNEYSLGDVTGDGKINAADARTALRGSSGIEKLTDKQVAAADIDGNGKVTAADARIILRIASKLDSIDNYLGNSGNDEPPVENPPVENPPVEIIELSSYMFADINDVLADISELEYREETETDLAGYYYEGLRFVVDKNDIVYNIAILGEVDASIYGITFGEAAGGVSEKISSNGFDMEMIGLLYGYNPDTELNIHVTLDETENTVATVALWSESEEFVDSEVDLGSYISLHIDELLEVCPELTTEDGESYRSDALMIEVDEDGYVYDISIVDETSANIYGVTYGTSLEDAIEMLVENGFVMGDETSGYNEFFGEYIIIMCDDSDNVIWVNLYTETYSNDLGWYINSHIDDLLVVYPELTTEDGFSYRSDALMIEVDVNGYIYDVSIVNETSASIYGVTYGTSLEDAIALLVENGFVMDDESSGYNEGYNEYVTIMCDETDTVTWVYVYTEHDNHDLGMIIGTDISNFMEMVTDLTQDADDETCYSNDWLTVYVNENDSVWDIYITDETEYSIYGVTYGTPVEEVEELLNVFDFVMDDPTYGYSELYDECIGLVYDESESYVEYINLWISSEANMPYIDLGSYIGMDLNSFLFATSLVLEQDEMTETCYYNDWLTVYVNDNNVVWDIYIADETEYSIYGVTYGTPVEDVEDLLAEYGFVMDDSTFGYCEEYDEYISLVFDESESYVEYINLWMADSMASEGNGKPVCGLPIIHF